MNILFVFYSFPGIGGVESVSNSLIDYLGQHYTIYTIAFHGDDTAPKSSRITESYRFRFHEQDKENNIRFFNRLTGTLNIDLVINQGMYPELTDIILNNQRKRDMKIISVLHGMPGYEKRQFWALDMMKNASKYKQTERRLLSHIGLNQRYNNYLHRYRQSYRNLAEGSDRIVLLAENYIEDFISRYRVKRYADKICAIENPLGQKYTDIKEPEWEDKDNNILYVGRLSSEKRVDIILDLWENVSRPDWHLYIVGDGPEMEYLKNKSKNLKNVIFTGYIKDPSEYYAKGKIVLLTSEFEGFSMCLIEAQRFGAVPVTYDISAGVSDIVANGGGITVPQDKFNLLCMEVSSLMNDSGTLKALSETAYKKSKGYLIGNIGKRWISLIENL